MLVRRLNRQVEWVLRLGDMGRYTRYRRYTHYECYILLRRKWLGAKGFVTVVTVVTAVTQPMDTGG